MARKAVATYTEAFLLKDMIKNTFDISRIDLSFSEETGQIHIQVDSQLTHQMSAKKFIEAVNNLSSPIQLGLSKG